MLGNDSPAAGVACSLPPNVPDFIDANTFAGAWFAGGGDADGGPIFNELNGWVVMGVWLNDGWLNRDGAPLDR